MRYLFLLICLSSSVFAHQIDVVIPVHKKDANTLDVFLDAIEKNILGVRRVIIISSERFTDRAEWIDESLFPFSISDVADELGGKGGIGTNVRRGWYYQQLLKFYSFDVIDDLLDNILILDSDTIPLKPIKFIEDDGRVYLDSHSWGMPFFFYHMHTRKVLPMLKDIDVKKNPVTHHMVFSRDIIRELFDLVEETFQDPFWKVFSNKVLTDHDKPMYLYLGASEYMLYYHFCKSYFPQRVIDRYVSILDDAKNFSVKTQKGHDFISAHQYDRTE